MATSLSPARVRCLAATARRISRPASFSTSSKQLGYADTLPNLRIGSHTKVLYQGFTGRQATANAQESIDWGTKIVGGVKPGVEGEHLGLPIFPSVRAAKKATNPDASAIYVPGDQTAKAIEEAIESEIPLVVAVAEHVPVHDMLRVHAMLRTQSKTRLVGANCPGIVSVVGRCRIGFQPLPCFSPGKIGIVNKSGTLSYETFASTTRAGLGQSLCISMGGDVLAGTTFVDALKVFEHDPDTEGIILIGEVGGVAELDAAEWIKDYHRRTSNPKPIMALVGGLEAPEGRIMGHAGAWAAPGEPSAKAKYEALEKAGVTMVSHPEKFGEGMKTLLANRGFQSSSFTQSRSAAQQRGYHTMRRYRDSPVRRVSTTEQRRSLYVKPHQAFDILKEAKIETNERAASPGDINLAMGIDRTSLSPCITVSSSNSPSQNSLRFPFAQDMKTHSANKEAESLANEIVTVFGLPPSRNEPLRGFIRKLWGIFVDKEAFLLSTRLSIAEKVVVHEARLGFDDAAFRSAGRQKDVHALRDVRDEVPEEVRAEKQGVIYVKLDGEGSIGTLVNGAGLAMNTVDCLILKGGHPANFLDTGGKATSATIEGSFRILCSDPRIKTIFVNIFGGLTRCDMIAEGIINAFKNLNMTVPVVVRLRGTNEEKGQRMIAESGLSLHSFDGFDEAADKAISLAKEAAQKA